MGPWRKKPVTLDGFLSSFGPPVRVGGVICGNTRSLLRGVPPSCTFLARHIITPTDHSFAPRPSISRRNRLMPSTPRYRPFYSHSRGAPDTPKDATLVNLDGWMQVWKQRSIAEPTKACLLVEYHQTMEPGLFQHLEPRQLLAKISTECDA